jgi:predicted DNA-binding WGR domain protein
VRRWELVADGSAKFWEIGRNGTEVTVRYGRLGSAGQTKVKDFTTDALAVAHVDKLVAEKVKKGYGEIGGGPVAAAGGSTADGGEAVAASESVAASGSTADGGGSVVAGGSTADGAPGVERPDETTFVVPPSWRVAAKPGRGQGGRRAVKSARDVEAYLRSKLEPRPARLAAALVNRKSEPELVEAAQAYLDDRPTPLGAAVVGATLTDEASRYYGREDVATLADAWVVRHGFPFAAQAVSDLGRLEVFWSGAGRTGTAAVTWRTDDDTTWPYANRQVVERLRTLLAGADEADYLAVVEALSSRREDLLTRTIAAFLAPTRHDWADELVAEVLGRSSMVAEHRLFLGSLRTVEQVEAAFAVNAYRWWSADKEVLPTIVCAVGPAIAPVLAGLLDDNPGDDPRKLLVDAIAWTPTDEAFGLLLARVDEKFVLPAVVGAVKRYPVRALRMLASASGSATARSLLVGHVRANPDLVAAVLPELDEDLRAAVESAAADEETVPDAPADLVPRVLVTPPWTVEHAAVEPIVVTGLESPTTREIRWRAGEQEVWAETFGTYYWSGATFPEWAVAVARLIGGKIPHHMQPALVLKAPKELLRRHLADWRPETWAAMDWAKPFVARFEVDALPVALRIAKADPSTAAELLLPFADDEVALLMADWLARLKSVHAVAVTWLLRHPETAVRALLPAALAKPGKARREAEAALRLVAARGHADVVRRVAAEHGERVVEGVEALITADPLDHLPAKMPVVGDWADPVMLPRIRLRDKEHALPVTAVGHVLTMLAMSKPDDVYAGVDVVRELCDPESLARFAWAAFEAWRANGTPPKDGWVLPAQGLFGDDETVRALSPIIRAWPGEGGHSKAVAGLGVLAAIGTDVALAHLNGIAQKAQFGGLKARAREKIDEVAAELGLTGEQLADRLVPDFGLDDAATLVVDYGPRKFVVGFDEQLKPYVVDGDGKRRKDLPKPGAKDDPELAPAEHKRFATLKKDVRTIAADQIRRFEAAMVARRRWSAEEFRTLFAGHPLLWHVVRRLVWTTEDGRAFRLAEDRTVADVHDDAVELAEDAVVGIAHPLELGESVEAWAEVFADYEILQPFPQLGRPVHALTEDERTATTLERFQDAKVPVGKLLGLTNKGWRRGVPQDAGMECWITRPLPGGGSVVVNLDPGIAVGVVTMFEEQRLADIWHNAGGNEWNRTGARKFGELDPVTASEVLADLTSLTS